MFRIVPGIQWGLNKWLLGNKTKHYCDICFIDKYIYNPQILLPNEF